jgi:hypothetical protein
MERFCKDCKHYRPHINFGMYVIPERCVRPLSDRTNPVTGEPADRLDKTARSERKNARTIFGRQRCGPDAIFFEPGE